VRRARTLAAIAGLLLVPLGHARPAAQTSQPSDRPALSPRNASYRINARLDVARRTIAADEVLTWRNTTARAAATLQFHLYYNAWRDDRSTWMRERRLADPSATTDVKPGDWSSIDLSTFTIASGGRSRDVMPRLRYIAPDDGNADDRTVVEVPLDTPVAPGGTI